MVLQAGKQPYINKREQDGKRRISSPTSKMSLEPQNMAAMQFTPEQMMAFLAGVHNQNMPAGQSMPFAPQGFLNQPLPPPQASSEYGPGKCQLPNNSFFTASIRASYFSSLFTHPNPRAANMGFFNGCKALRPLSIHTALSGPWRVNMRRLDIDKPSFFKQSWKMEWKVGPSLWFKKRPQQA